MTGTATWRDDAGRDLIRNAGDRFALFVRGEGAYVWDEHGTRYLDFLAGIAVNSLGHAHPVFVDAVATQAATLAHVSNYFATPPQLALAAKLKELAGTGPSGRVYFANSGAEANEAAFKLARLHGAARDGRPARLRILTLENAFHGRTMGTLALTGKPAMQEPFLPMVAGVEHIAPTIEALEHAMGDDVAALVVESEDQLAYVTQTRSRARRVSSTCRRDIWRPHASSRLATVLFSSSMRSRPVPAAQGSGSATSMPGSPPTRSPSRRGSEAASRSALW